MPMKKVMRGGKRRLVIEIPYKDRDTGKRVRFRQDATIQTVEAAKEEERRLLAELLTTGRIQTVRDRREAHVGTSEVVDDKLTFQGAVDLWRATKAPTLKRTTQRGYEVNFDAYLLPLWGQVPVRELGFERFAKLDATLIKDGLAPSSRGNIAIAARSVLRHLVELGKLETMPRLPSIPHGGGKVIRIPDTMTVDAMLREAPAHLRRALLLCLDAGLRAGEVRGLTWKDVDLGARTITVRQTIYYGETDTPKSGHERVVPLTDRLYRELTAGFAERPKTTDPVAPNGRGKVWGEPSLSHAVRSLLRAIDAPHARVHDLRHFFVSRLFRAGVGAPTVRDLAGHRHMHVTARYAHSDEGAKREAIAALG